MSKTIKGFLLTRDSFDYHGKTQIVLWLSTIDGPVKVLISDEMPIFFIPQTQFDNVQQLLSVLGDNFKLRHLPLKTFSQQAVTGVYFNTLATFFEARRILKNNNVICYEANFRLEERFLMERFVYAGVEVVGKVIEKNGFTECHHAKLKASAYVPQLSMLSIDIECAENGELYSIGLYAKRGSNEFRQVIMIGSISNKADREEYDYIHWVETEVALLNAFQESVYTYDPDIIIGWNVINFDFRVLHQRARLNSLKLKLGRNRQAMRWRDSRTDKNSGFVSIEGRVVIDGIAAMKAESYSFPSFSLEAIAMHFLKRGKSADNVDDRLAEITYNFHHDKVKLAAYNLEDCRLVWDIFEKIKLLDFLIFRSQLTGLELDRAGGSVAAFTNLYLPKLHRHGYISPNLPEGGGLASPGGYVMESKPGLYQNVLVLDFKSLYPSIIRTFKIDPLGLIEGGKQPEQAIEGYRGGCFSREKHLLPDIISQLWQQRDQAKKDKDSARSQAIKIIMNSFYGVLGSGGCAFYNPKLASSITLRGHDIMQQTARWIESAGFEVIYGDTDSTFVLLDSEISTKKSVEIGQALAKSINQQWDLKLAQEYQIESYLEIEFESYFSRFLMPTIRGSAAGSKKRYAGIIKRGDEEKLIFKGLENVRSDWTKLAKTFQKELYQMVFREQDPSAFINETIQQTLAGLRDADLIYRKRLRRPLSSYVKNIPPHVRAARLADEINLSQGRSPKYQNKGWIQYYMTINGPQPVEYLTAKIDYQHYVDKQLQPVADAILPFCGYSFEKITDTQLGLF